jgi:CBS domain-containing protein
MADNKLAVNMQNGAPDAAELDSIAVKDVMRPGAVACPRDATLPSVAAIMVAHGIHAVLVAPSHRGTPLVVTDLDLVRAALDQADDAKAGELAREPIVVLSADAALAAAVEAMTVRYVTHVLVVDPVSGEPAGIVSSLDIAALVGGIQPRVLRLPRIAPTRPSPSARTLTDAAVRDVMHPGVVTCSPDSSLRAVARMMADHHVHCIAVAGVADDGESGQHLTWGLIADIDLVRAAHGHTLDAPATKIAATAPVAVREDQSLHRAAALMAEHATSHVVVVGPQGLPTGILSTLDVASIIALR